jgi:hypothetical protein
MPGVKVELVGTRSGVHTDPFERELGSRSESGIGGRSSGGGTWARPVLAPEERRWSSDVFPYGDL